MIIGARLAMAMSMPHDVRAAAEAHHDEEQARPDQEVQNIL
jgi:HD-like signal output (HDOD) protein